MAAHDKPRNRWQRGCGALLIMFLMVLLQGPLATAVHAEGAVNAGAIRTGSRAPYLHRLSLYDGTGTAIAPQDEPARPFSSARTCGKCHEYGTIGAGWHFNAADPVADPGRPGEPWILNDLKTGTQLPLSWRNWPGAWKPDAVGLTPWDFVRTFGRHLPGGGLGEKHDLATSATAATATATASASPANGAPAQQAAPTPSTDDLAPVNPDADLTPVNPDAAPSMTANSSGAHAESGKPAKPRWGAAGSLEIDCMACHSADLVHDRGDWVDQILAQNYRYAPTTAVGLGVTRGSAKNLPENFNPDDASNAGGGSGPKLIWDKTKFDPNDRALFNVTGKPRSEQCYDCHTARLVGEKAPAEWHGGKDVHLAAGLTCADCHGNGIDHQTVRGAESGQPGKHPVADSFSCRGCHVGVAGAENLRGRYGAPYPKHKGLPPLHLEKLACTACHSGPLPEKQTKFVQTSLAHGLGLAEQGRRGDVPPFIQEPVFMKGADGRIGPQRILWPAFWGRLKDGKVTPLAPAAVAQAAPAVFGAKEVKPADWAPLDAARITAALQALATDKTTGEPVYIAEGQMRKLDPAGKLVTADNAAAKPYAWALGHDVRPAQQALGAHGCTDCHSTDSAFFFGQVTAAGPLKLEQAPALAMTAMQGLDGAQQRLWGVSFILRPFFKMAGFAASGLIGCVLSLYGFAGLGRLLRLARGRK